MLTIYIHSDKIKIMERNLNSNHLKLIAIAAMTLDHAAWIFFPGFSTVWYVMIFHAIGRITAPIMWFFISEGFHYTRDVKKYALRLFIFAVISHFSYNYLSGHSFIPCVDSFFNQTSVIWALFWGLILLIFCTDKKNPVWAKILFIIAVCIISFPADWSSIACIAVLLIGGNYGNFKKQMILMMASVSIFALVYFFCIDKVYGVLQLCTALSIPLLRMYNGNPGKQKWMKWFFYIYYPLHMVVLKIISDIVPA